MWRAIGSCVAMALALLFAQVAATSVSAKAPQDGSAKCIDWKCAPQTRLLPDRIYPFALPEAAVQDDTSPQPVRSEFRGQVFRVNLDAGSAMSVSLVTSRASGRATGNGGIGEFTLYQLDGKEWVESKIRPRIQSSSSDGPGSRVGPTSRPAQSSAEQRTSAEWSLGNGRSSAQFALVVQPAARFPLDLEVQTRAKAIPQTRTIGFSEDPIRGTVGPGREQLFEFRANKGDRILVTASIKAAATGGAGSFIGFAGPYRLNLQREIAQFNVFRPFESDSLRIPGELKVSMEIPDTEPVQIALFALDPAGVASYELKLVKLDCSQVSKPKLEVGQTIPVAIGQPNDSCLISDSGETEDLPYQQFFLEGKKGQKLAVTLSRTKHEDETSDPVLDALVDAKVYNIAGDLGDPDTPSDRKPAFAAVASSDDFVSEGIDDTLDARVVVEFLAEARLDLRAADRLQSGLAKFELSAVDCDLDKAVCKIDPE